VSALPPVIGDDEDMILVANDPPTPEILDHCLATIEAYIETVRDHGHTQTPVAVMAQMYEAFLYGFWAPFANQYAEALSSPSRTLDNVLQHLYIEGKSDAGKDKLTEYILRLISDNTVVSGVDADDVGVGEIRGIREWDTCFPYAIIDAEKQKSSRTTRRSGRPRPGRRRPPVRRGCGRYTAPGPCRRSRFPLVGCASRVRASR